MAVFKCKMCGGDLNVKEGATVVECEYCGTAQTVSCSDDEKRINLYNRANRLRINSEFDKAANIYESIVAEFPEEAEAYWGLVICNYGIEYVDDPLTAKKIPTCHRASFDSIQSDENYKLALEYADIHAQRIYRNEAREIDRIREEILAISKNEKPYDIFICYKETDDNGERTIDSVIAQDVYDSLTAKGYKVFFSRISLEDKLGRQYEPYIFAALNSAKVMLSIGTTYEYFHAVWVKNEWSRFLKLMAKDKSKLLIPCYKDMDAYDLPDEFKALQAQNLGKVGAVQDLLRGIEKVINSPQADAPKHTDNTPRLEQNPNTVPLLRRAFLFIEDEEWQRADELCENVLNQDPENGEAYIAKLLIEYRVTCKENLEKVNLPINTSKNFSKIIRFGTEEQKSYVRAANDTVLSRLNEQAKARQREQEEKQLAERRAQEEKFALTMHNGVSSYEGTLCPHCGNAVPDSLFLNIKYDEESNGETTCPTCNENLFFAKDYIDMVLANIQSNQPYAETIELQPMKKPDEFYFDVDYAQEEIRSLSLNELKNRILDEYTWSEGYRYLCRVELESRKGQFYK